MKQLRSFASLKMTSQRLCACGFEERRGVVGSRVKRDAVATRGFLASRNDVALCIADHEGSKRLLERIGGAVLLLKSAKRYFFCIDFLPQGLLENSNGIDL